MSLSRVDYDNARRQAQKLQAAADECDEIIRKLKLAWDSSPTIGKENQRKSLSTQYKQESARFKA